MFEWVRTGAYIAPSVYYDFHPLPALNTSGLRWLYYFAAYFFNVCWCVLASESSQSPPSTKDRFMLGFADLLLFAKSPLIV